MTESDDRIRAQLRFLAARVETAAIEGNDRLSRAMSMSIARNAARLAERAAGVRSAPRIDLDGDLDVDEPFDLASPEGRARYRAWRDEMLGLIEADDEDDAW